MRTIDDMPRERAVNRINEKRNLALNMIVYLVMNAVFVAGWAPNAGQPLPGGFFWPIIPIVAWGTGLLIYGYHVYGGRQLHQVPVVVLGPGFGGEIGPPRSALPVIDREAPAEATGDNHGA